MTVETSKLPLSGFYPDNPFFTSPFLPIREDAGSSMWQAIEIYDSLSTTGNNSEAAYRLAEIRFRAMGDLDGALTVYRDVNKSASTKKLKIDSGLRIADVFIAKGDLSGAERELELLKKQFPNILEYKMKSCQVLFYKGEFQGADDGLREIAKNLEKGKSEYNNVLEVMAVLIGFRHNQDEFKKFAEIQLNIQQNKRTEALEKLRPLFATNEIFIADMCRYQHAWLNYLQGNIESTGLMLAEIQNETIFKELAHIFMAEILDYITIEPATAIDSYLEFLELYPMSIYYDDIRLRLRELTS